MRSGISHATYWRVDGERVHTSKANAKANYHPKPKCDAWRPSGGCSRRCVRTLGRYVNTAMRNGRARMSVEKYLRLTVFKNAVPPAKPHQTDLKWRINSQLKHSRLRTLQLWTECTQKMGWLKVNQRLTWKNDAFEENFEYKSFKVWKERSDSEPEVDPGIKFSGQIKVDLIFLTELPSLLTSKIRRATNFVSNYVVIW